MDDFAGFAARARPSLVHLARSNGRPDDAEDAAQTALAAVMLAWPRLSAEPWPHQHAYARRAVVNTCRSEWRRYGSRTVLDEPEETAGHNQDDDALDLRSAFSRLPWHQKRIIFLRYVVGLADAEIARRVGCPPVTVRTASARGLRALREALAA